MIVTQPQNCSHELGDKTLHASCANPYLSAYGSTFLYDLATHFHALLTPYTNRRMSVLKLYDLSI